MSWRSRFESWLLIGALLASLPCYCLSTDCLTPRTPADIGHVDKSVSVPSPDINELNVTVSGVPDGSPGLHGFVEQVPPDPATPVACVIQGELALWDGSFFVPDPLPRTDASGDLWSTAESKPVKASADPPLNELLVSSKPTDSNRDIYYRNKLEFALDVGTLPINIPFPFDFMEGDPYREHPLKYTLVPIIASLRWHITNIGGPWIFRGNWDLTSSGSFTWIPSGPETRYISYDMGVRRNFVPRNRRFAPYFDMRLGVGQINAKGPKGVTYAQGENWPEFTMNMGSGVRYNFGPRYAFSAGINYMHISNMDLSEHKPTATDPQWGLINYGINVYGPMLGIDVQLRRHHTE